MIENFLTLLYGQNVLLSEFNIGWQEAFDHFDAESDIDALAAYLCMSV